jgi:hypothetical protein
MGDICTNCGTMAEDGYVVRVECKKYPIERITTIHLCDMCYTKLRKLITIGRF